MSKVSTADLSALSYSNGFTLWHYRTPQGHNPFELDYWTSSKGVSAMWKNNDMMFVEFNNVMAVCVIRIFESGSYQLLRQASV